MYRLAEYYWEGRTGRPTQYVLPQQLSFETLEEARDHANTAYQIVRRVPESEKIVLLVHDSDNRVVYSIPEHPWTT